MPTTPTTILPAGQRPLPTLVTLLPFILFLEIALLLGGPSIAAARVLAHEHIGQALSFFGLSPTFVLHATGSVVVAILLTWHVLTGGPWTVRVSEVLRLLLEGFIAMAPLLAAAAFFGTLRETALAVPTSIVPNSTVDAIAIAIGAGLSEELLFRMVGVACVHWILSDICGVKTATTLIVAVVATSVAFTLYHSPSSLSSAGIVFVAAASLYLGVLYVLRGFAVAVIAHAGYDAIVLLSLDVN